MTGNAILDEDLRQIHRTVQGRGEWDGAIIVITGCGGFLGFLLTQYFVRQARALGIRKVIGLDTFLVGTPQWAARLAEQFPQSFALHAFDIAKDDLERVEGSDHARYVIHAASVASPMFYRRYPLETIDANVWGLRRLLEFYRERTHLKGFLFFSSSEIYGDPEADSIPTPEVYRGNVSCVGPRACYDESKRFGETLCHVFAKTYGMLITVARPFNNYGPGMRRGDGRLPADLAEAVLDGRDIVIFSDGLPTRTFCYASDAVAGYLLALAYGQYDYFNIGMDREEISVRDLAGIYARAGAESFGYAGKVEFEPSVDPDYLADNPSRRCPDISKARDKLGFDPKIGTQEGVRRHLQFLSLDRAQNR